MRVSYAFLSQLGHYNKTSPGVFSVVDKLKEAFEQYFNHPEWLKWSNGQDKEVFFYKGKPLNRERVVSMLQLIYEEAGIEGRYVYTTYDIRWPNFYC